MIAKKNIKISSKYNFILIGIVTSLNDYRLCWLLNQHSNLELIRIDNLKLNNTSIEFSLFQYHDKKTFIIYHLISNKSENGILLDDFKMVDFFIHLSGNIENANIKQLIKNIQQLEEVATAFEINTSKIRNNDIFIL